MTATTETWAELDAWKTRARVAEEIIRVMWPYALSGSVHRRHKRDSIVLEALHEHALADDALRVVRREQWKAFDNHLVPGPPLPDMWEPGRED